MSEIVAEILASTRAEAEPDPGDANKCWLLARSNLAERLPQSDFKTWIEPLKTHRAEPGRLVLAGPNPFFINWVKSHFLGDLASALAAAGFAPTAPLEFVAASAGPAAETEEGSTDPSPPGNGPANEPFQACRSTPPQHFGGRFTFENFVVGASNRYAYSAAKALADGEVLGSDALFITSDHGLGKSHLSLALGRVFLQNKSRPQVHYLTAEDFTNEMTHALRHGLMEDFKSKYRQDCDVLVLEEVQFLAGKEKIQSELCFTLDCLMEKGKKMVFTSPQEPKDIPRLSRSLRSRLATALVSPIGPPDYATRLNILMKKARAANIKIPRAVLEYLAERVTSDVRQLESCLISLRAKSQLLNRQVDLDMAREALTYLFDAGTEGAGTEGGLTLLGVRALICRYFHLEAAEITSRDRSAKLTEARSLGIYLARRLTARTLEEIGRTFGRTHSSALYACNKMDLQLKKDPKLQGRLDFLQRQLVERQST